MMDSITLIVYEAERDLRIYMGIEVKFRRQAASAVGKQASTGYGSDMPTFSTA